MGILDAPFRAPTRVQNWARGFRGVIPRFKTMAAPPTITFGGNASTVDGGKVNGNTTVNAADARLGYFGSIFVSSTSAGFPIKNPEHISNSSGVRSGSNAPIRVRFMSDAPAIDFCFRDNLYSQFNLLIDGEFVARAHTAVFGNTGNFRYIKSDFGTDVVTYGKAVGSLGALVGGTGHAVGDVLTMDGGTASAGGPPCQMRVAQVSGGAVTSMDVANAGAYTSLPTGTLTQVSSTGAGTGCSFGASFFQQYHSTRKMRTYELVFSQPGQFLGLVVTSQGTVLGCPINLAAPKICFIGDSITIGTYLSYGAGHIGSSIAQMLGMWDQHIINGIGGTGWNTSNPSWSNPYRIQDFIDCDADIYCTVGSQNDAAGTALETAVTSTVNAVLAAKPKAMFVGVGNIVGASASVAASIGVGYAAVSDQRRVRYINNQSPTSWNPSATTNIWTVTNDAAHLSQDGMDRFACIAAPHVANAILDMAA